MAHSNPTFRSYSSTQAKAYAAGRPGYSSALLQVVIQHHVEAGGMLGTVLDVGCGPGTATQSLAPHFEDAIGVDSGEQMIEMARRIGGTTRSGRSTRYELCSAENLTQLSGVAEGSVDMVTAAMAAHWFDMDGFWHAVASLLRPGGTVALWTLSSFYCHPATPNAAAVQAHLFRLERGVLAPFELPSSRLSRDMYRNLPMPWSLTPPLPAFRKDEMVRREWDVDGVLSDGHDFFGGSTETSLDELERGLGTSSMVTRWREAHADQAGTEDDCVRRMMRDVRQAMGVEAGQDAKIRASGATALIMLRKQL